MLQKPTLFLFIVVAAMAGLTLAASAAMEPYLFSVTVTNETNYCVHVTINAPEDVGPETLLTSFNLPPHEQIHRTGSRYNTSRGLIRAYVDLGNSDDCRGPFRERYDYFPMIERGTGDPILARFFIRKNVQGIFIMQKG